MGAAKWRAPPKVGRIFERTFKNKTYRMRVVKRDSEIGFEVDEKVFDSPSAAAKYVTKKETNGWRFWEMD